MEIKCKKKDNISKLFIVVCVGLLLLIVVFPVKKTNSEYITDQPNEDATCETETEYYENRLKTILEDTYGIGTMDVMIHMTSKSNDNMLYGSETKQYKVDGVLVVAQVKDAQAVSDITFAVCALFDLPAHKVAVMIKK